MDALRGEMMEVRFDGPIEEVGGGPALGDAEDLVVRIKNADEDELWVVLFEIVVLTEEGFVGEDGGILIPALLNRMASTKGENRLKMIVVLRKLASHSNENKVGFWIHLCSFRALQSMCLLFCFCGIYS